MKRGKKNKKGIIRRNISAAAFSGFFCGVIGTIGAALIFLERPVESLTENRMLEERPEFSAESYLSGEFAAKLDKYFTDTVPYRDELNEMAAVLEKVKGFSAPKFYGVSVVGDNEDSGGESTEYTAPTDYNVIAPETESAVTTAPPQEVQTALPSTETSPAPSVSEEQEVSDVSEFLNNGILVDGVDMYGRKAGVMLFGGNKTQGARYANLISEYKRQLGDGVNVYNMVVPTSAEFYLPKKYAKYSNSEKEAIDYIYSNLSDGVIPVDAYSVLEQHKDEYIYFRTDHHWTDLGAYYAYTAFCDVLGQTPPALEDYTVKTKPEPYVGSLFGYTNDITLKNNPDTFTYYMTKSEYTAEGFYYDTLKSSGPTAVYHEYASGSAMYGTFLGSDSMHIKIKTNAGTGRKIVMFKESYGNAFAPYLIDSFDEIYIIDIRYFGKNALQYIKEVGATDVLFINNAFAANTSSLIGGIERMLISPKGTITEPPPTESTTAEESLSESSTKPNSSTQPNSSTKKTEKNTVPTTETDSSKKPVSGTSAALPKQEETPVTAVTAEKTETQTAAKKEQ